MEEKYNINKIDLDKVELTQVKDLYNGGKYIYLCHKRQFLRICTPVLYSHFGASFYIPRGKTPIKPNYTLQLSLNNDLKKFLQTLQHRLLQLVKDKGIKYNHFYNCVRPNKDQNFPNYVRVKLNYDDDDVFTSIFFLNNVQVDEATTKNMWCVVPPKGYYRCLLHVQALWLVNGKLGLKLKVEEVHKVEHQQEEKSNDECLILSD